MTRRGKREREREGEKKRERGNIEEFEDQLVLSGDDSCQSCGDGGH